MTKCQHLRTKLWKGFVFAILSIVGLSTSIIAQDEYGTECPYFNVTAEQSNGPQFSLLSTDVHATVSGVIANVTIEQTYYNAGASEVDATYVFPMSSQAAVYAMEMIIGDRVVEAVIKSNTEAQEIYEAANDAGLTASLLEQQRPNVFQMSLANIASGDSISVRMKYTELLVPTSGVYQFVFPSVVGPRFTTGSEDWVPLAIQQFVPLTETELNVNLRINAGMPFVAECTSHEADFDYVSLSGVTEVNTNPGADFIVNYTLDDNQIETGLLLYEGDEENFFLAMIQPPKPEVDYESPPREYTFVLDISGSMNGYPIETAKELLSDLVANLKTYDRFNVVFFAGGSAVLSETSLYANPDNIQLALEMIDDVNSGGSTYLLPALQTALDMEGTEDYSRTFVIITDGQVTVERAAYELIRENLNEANFFAFGIGNSPNRYIIEGIAYIGQGEPFFASSITEAQEQAQLFRSYIERPALTNIATYFDAIDAYDIEPISIPDVFAERPIIIYGKYNQPATGNLTLTGDYHQGSISTSFDFEDYTDNAHQNEALRYLWARQKIKLLSDYGIGGDEASGLSIEEEITQLGLQYSLVTAYTSFVAVDSSALAAANEGQDPGGVYEGDLNSSVSVVDLQDDSGPEILQILGRGPSGNGVLRIKLYDLSPTNEEQIQFEVRDMSGRLVWQSLLETEDLQEIMELPVGILAHGVYLISLSSSDGLLETKRFVVE